MTLKQLQRLEQVFRWTARLVGVSMAYGAGLGLLLGFTGLGAGLWFLDSMMKDLPSIEELHMDRPSETTKVYAAGGDLLGEFFLENRNFTPIHEIPERLKKAFLAVEDTDFETHRGVKFESLMRAVMAMKKSGRASQGGSTITMQITRDLYLSREKTFIRKFKEIILAFMLEQRFSKDEILEMYLNKIYFGEFAYGVYTAAQTYFGKVPKDLTIAESAFLAGVVQRPSRHSAYRNIPQATARRNLVLGRMLKVGFITQMEHDEAVKEPFKLRYKGLPPPPSLERLKYPHFTTFVLGQLLDTYGKDVVYGGGLKVYTTLDVEKQKLAEQALAAGLERYGKAHRVSEGAVVTLEVGTGHILAMVGGRDFRNSKFNRAAQALRQPGSSFKPIVYATACEEGFNMSSRALDAPTRIPLGGGRFYEPKNSGKGHSGWLTLRQALTRSVNVVAVKVINQLGPEKVIAMARRFGVTAPLHPVLSLALGSNEVVPLEMTAAFAVFPQQGLYVPPTGIARITDRLGKVVYEGGEEAPRRAISEKCAFALVQAMKDVVTRGTARAARVKNHIVAGKTGTTSDFKDAWFIGYTPHLTTAVWVGNDSGQVMRRVFGGTVPAPIWQDYMSKALGEKKGEDFPEPSVEMTKAELGLGRGETIGDTRRHKRKSDEDIEIEDQYVKPSFFEEYADPLQTETGTENAPQEFEDELEVETTGGQNTRPAPGPLVEESAKPPQTAPEPPRETPPTNPPPRPAPDPPRETPPPAPKPAPKPTVPMVDFEEADDAF